MRTASSKRNRVSRGSAVATEATGRIVAAARRHFFTHGFRSVTMDDLAEELGMSKKTLYAAFPSKAELLRTVLLQKFDAVDSDLEQATAALSTDVLGALHELLACMQRHTSEIQAPFVRDMRRENPEFFKLIEDRRRQIIQRYFGKIFDEGRRAGILRRDIPARLMIEILVGATEAIMNPPKMAELGLTLNTGYVSVVTVILEGLLTAKGRAT